MVVPIPTCTGMEARVSPGAKFRLATSPRPLGPCSLTRTPQGFGFRSHSFSIHWRSFSSADARLLTHLLWFLCVDSVRRMGFLFESKLSLPLFLGDQLSISFDPFPQVPPLFFLLFVDCPDACCRGQAHRGEGPSGTSCGGSIAHLPPPRRPTTPWTTWDRPFLLFPTAPVLKPDSNRGGSGIVGPIPGVDKGFERTHPHP